MRNLLVTGALAGAGAMYFLDPERGRRRRALVRDEIDHLRRQFEDELDAGSRDAANRARGVVATIARLLTPADDADDRTVADRVRSTLGRLTSHPRAIEVAVTDGRVRLAGPILAVEADAVRAAVVGVRGVTSFDDALVLHETAAGVPQLQGHAKRPGATRVPPAARMALGALAATSLFGGGLRGRILRAAAMAALGAVVGKADRDRPRSDRHRHERGHERGNGHALQ